MHRHLVLLIAISPMLVGGSLGFVITCARGLPSGAIPG